MRLVSKKEIEKLFPETMDLVDRLKEFMKEISPGNGIELWREEIMVSSIGPLSDSMREKLFNELIAEYWVKGEVKITLHENGMWAKQFYLIRHE